MSYCTADLFELDNLNLFEFEFKSFFKLEVYKKI